MSSLLGLVLTRSEEITEVVESLRGDDQARREQRLSVCHNAIAANLLILGVVDTEQVVGGLLALGDGEEGDVLAVGDDLFCWLLEDGQLLVDLGQGSGAEVVDLLDVGRDVLVGPGKVGDDGLREGLVGRVAQLYRLLAVGVALERREGIAHDGVAGDVLRQGESSGSAKTPLDSVQLVTQEQELTWSVAEDGWVSPLTWAAILWEGSVGVCVGESLVRCYLDWNVRLLIRERAGARALWSWVLTISGWVWEECNAMTSKVSGSSKREKQCDVGGLEAIREDGKGGNDRGIKQ